MTPEIEAAIKGHPDTITAHGILAREITDLRARLAASEAEVARIKADAQQRYGEALGERDEEKRKREEAERKHGELVEAGEVLKGYAQSYAMQTYDRQGTVAKAVTAWEALTIPAQEKESQEKS